MTEEKIEDMIHETLESGGRTTQTKGHEQELIVTLMSSKCSLGNVFLFLTYLVVAKTQIKFSEVLSTTHLIQEIINVRNREVVLDGNLIEGTKVGTRAPSTFFLKYHDHKGRIRAGNGADNTHLEKIPTLFFQFHSFGQRGDNKGKHWEEYFHEQGEWNDHENHEKEEGLEGWKKQLDVWKE